jgi:hypothetical protein
VETLLQAQMDDHVRVVVLTARRHGSVPGAPGTEVQCMDRRAVGGFGILGA